MINENFFIFLNFIISAFFIVKYLNADNQLRMLKISLKYCELKNDKKKEHINDLLDKLYGVDKNE